MDEVSFDLDEKSVAANGAPIPPVIAYGSRFLDKLLWPLHRDRLSCTRRPDISPRPPARWSRTAWPRTACPRPHPDLPLTPAPGSNVAYVSSAENARLVSQALALGLGRFRPAP